MKHLSVWTLVIVWLLGLSPCVVGQDQSEDLMWQEVNRRSLEARENVTKIVVKLYVKCHAQWRYASIMKACGYENMGKMVDVRSGELDAMIVEEFKQLEDLQYYDPRALLETVNGVKEYIDGYKYGYYESLNLVKHHLPPSYCKIMADEVDQLIQQNQNKE